MSIIEGYPGLLRQLRRLDPKLRQLLRKCPCDIKDVQEMFPNVRRHGTGAWEPLSLGSEPRKYKQTFHVSFEMLRPILTLPAELDSQWMGMWACSYGRKDLRTKYRAAMAVKVLAEKRGYETEFVQINNILYRIRKGRRMVMLDFIAEQLKAGEYMKIRVISEAHYKWELDQGQYADKSYTKDWEGIKVQDWTDK